MWTTDPITTVVRHRVVSFIPGGYALANWIAISPPFQQGGPDLTFSSVDEILKGEHMHSNERS